MSAQFAIRAALLGTLLVALGCSAVRPIMFWRDPRIVGQARLVDGSGAAIADAAPAGVTLNFIHRGGRLEDSLRSVQTDASGRYRSPALEPGEYTVEALLPGFVIESHPTRIRSHEYLRVDFALKQIRETSGRSQREAQDDNIPHPGEVQILPPPF